jgi:hypothetical protein
VLAGVSGIGGECFPGWAGGSSAVTGLLLIWVPGVPAVTRRACASGPGQHYGLQELAAALKLAPRSGPAWRAAPLALPWCSWWPGSLVELGVLAHRIPTSPGLRRSSPQNPHGRNGITRHKTARVLAWPRWP